MDDDAATSNAQFNVFITTLAASPLLLPDCVSFAMAVWDYQLENPMPVAVRREQVLRHMIACGSREWKKRWDMRALRLTAKLLLCHISGTEEVFLFADGFSNLVSRSFLVITECALDSSEGDIRAPGDSSYTVPTNNPCILCGTVNVPPNIEIYVRALQRYFRETCMDMPANIDSYINIMRVYCTPELLGALGLQENDVAQALEEHLLYHDNSPLSLYFLLRCIANVFVVRTFENGPSREFIGPSAFESKANGAVARASATLSKIRATIEKVIREGRCFGQHRVCGVRFIPPPARE